MRTKITDIIAKQPDISAIRSIVRTLTDGSDDPSGARSLLTETLMRVRGESVLSEQHLAFMNALEGVQPDRPVLNRESAFILTHAAICLLRAAAAEPELQLDRYALEDELVCLMESYLNALAARKAS